MASSWYLEHVTTSERFVLNNGENLIGRHSCCTITLGQIYQYVSREHVNIIVSDAGVIVQDLNSTNGVIINEQKMSGDLRRLPVVEGTVISLGVDGHITKVPHNYPIFVLRREATKPDEIVLSSEDDDDTMTLPAPKTNDDIRPKELHFSPMIADLGPIKKIATHQDEHPSCSNLYPPKIAELKQGNLLSKTTEEIANIFSEVYIDPYLGNQLNKQSGGTASTGGKIHDGDLIELDSDDDKEEMRPQPPPEPLESADDEYGEQFAMSQAVLQEIKAEMAYSDSEEDFLSSKNLEDEEQLGSPESNISYDDIIIINESDDDELLDKVADWSNKLLSQRVPDAIEMSQVYPMMEDSNSDQENDLFFNKKQQPRSIRIESSSEDEASELALCIAHSTSNHKLRSNERIQTTTGKESSTTDNAQLSSAAEVPKKLPLRNRSNSCYIERPKDVFETLKNGDIEEELNKDNPIEEVEDCREVLVVTLHAPEEPKKTPIEKAKGKTSLSLSRRNTIHCHEEGEVKTKPRKSGKTVNSRKQDREEPAKVSEAPTKTRCARLLNRSRSCYMERPIDMDEPLASIQEKEDLTKKESETRSKTRHKSIEKAPSKKSDKNNSNKTINSREQIEERTKETPNNRNSVKPGKKDTVGDVIPVKKGPSPRLLSRSKSCLIEKPIHIDNFLKLINTKEISPSHSGAPTSTDAPRLIRGPTIIEAPFMSKNRCKANMDKQRVIDRQRLIDNQAEMNAKWYQKPKDKKNDDQEIKEKRREALKKLSDKAKNGENSISSSNSNKRKNCSSVPTVSNTNRGEFLTKGIDSGPPTKIAKKVEKPKATTLPAKKSIPTFSQQLQAADKLVEHPRPRCSRPPERKEEAQQAREQRTCNHVDLADMKGERQRAPEAQNIEKLQRRVRFSDKVDIRYIDKVCGAIKPVQKSKDSLKIRHSTHSERREWTLKGNNMINDTLYHKQTILAWANQWLKLGSVDAVAETDVLMPIPSAFSDFQQYRKTFLPLMRLELLSTIERDYKSSKTTLDLKVVDVYCEKEYYRILARTNAKPIGRFDLYTLSSGIELAESFASLLAQKTVCGKVWDMTFQLCMQVSFEKMKSLKQLTARPVVDSLRVELGALSAIHQLHRSPLCRRILLPTEVVKTIQIPQVAKALAYKGYSNLNQYQKDICLRVYERVIDDVNPSVTLVQGPPGTGKSILLSNLSLQCLYGGASVILDRKILICAHSNTAVDHMVKTLGKAHSAMNRNQFKLLRFGMKEKMTEDSKRFSIEPYLRKARNEKLKRLTPENIESLKRQYCDLKNEIQRIKQNSKLTTSYLQNVLEAKQKQLLLISEQLNPPLTQREEFDIAEMCVKRAHIVCTTLSSCVKLANYVDFFDICIIDEATQCTEPWTLLPMRFGIKHLVLVGDTQQLPAVVLSKKAIDFGLGNSMFDRIQKSLVKDQPEGSQLVHTKLFKLSMQYRMHPEICRWPNKYFYDDQLLNADLTTKSSPLIPYCVINLSYTQDTSDSGGNKSISNAEEARFVAQLLAEMDKHMPSQRYSYGLISPYSSQCHALSQVIPRHMKLTPKTVDSYQGLEKDVIVISNARTRGYGFLANYQRLNVALTRPKRCLIICGNFKDLQSVDMWRQLLDDARQRNVYFDLKRDEVSDLKQSLMNKLIVKPLLLPMIPEQG